LNCPDCGERIETTGHMCRRTFIIPTVPTAFTYAEPKTREKRLEELVREAVENLEWFTGEPQPHAPWDAGDWVRRAKEVLGG